MKKLILSILITLMFTITFGQDKNNEIDSLNQIIIELRLENYDLMNSKTGLENDYVIFRFNSLNDSLKLASVIERLKIKNDKLEKRLPK